MRTDSTAPEGLVVVGRVQGLFGVRGWIKVYSYTRPREGILDYAPWLLQYQDQWHEHKLLAGKVHGKGIVAQLEGYQDRDQASSLVGADIAVQRSQLPALPQGEYYWAELVGLRVRNLAGIELGVVEYLFETGANDVIVVQGEQQRLIPYIPDVVKQVNLERGTLVVDWDADF